MRILVFTDEYDLGHYTFIYNEVKKLKEAGNEVFIVCERVGRLKENDQDYVCIPQTSNKFLQKVYLSANKRKLFSIVRAYAYFRKRKQIVREFKPDLVHIHFGDTAVRHYFPMEKLLRLFPLVVSFHGFDASYLLNRHAYVAGLKMLIGQPQFFGICVSRHLKENLVAKGLNVNHQNSAILYYGVDLTMFRRTRHANNQKKVFLQISGLDEKKGHVYTLRAFKKFIEHNKGAARLIIGGDGPLKAEIIKECRDLGLCNDVEFPGWLSREQAVAMLNEADYFVHHSVTAADGNQEGLPNAILEAMAMELPVISTYHSGIPELVEDGVNGFLVMEKDIDTYASRMEQILSWSYLPQNREKVERKFSLHAHTDGLVSIYQQQIFRTNTVK